MAAEVSSPARRRTRPARVAIVDDNPDTIESLALFLEVAGFETRPFSSGPTFLAALDGTEPAVVVLDLAMPEMDGVTVLRKLRESRNATTPVIVLSAHVDAVAARDLAHLGVAAILEKPVAAEKLLAVLEDAIAS